MPRGSGTRFGIKNRGVIPDEAAQILRGRHDRLQGLLTQLQDEATPLADSVKLYAEAAGLIHYCNTALDKARLQIEEIDASLAPDVEVPHDA